MKVCKAKISYSVLDFLNKNVFNYNTAEAFNQWLFKTYHIVDFCESEEDFENLKKELQINVGLQVNEDRTEYGDFQTPATLVEKTCKMLQMKAITPQICIEPTCGKGSFLLGALKNFPSLTHIYGIEVYKPYVWESKFNILDYYIETQSSHFPIIHIAHENVFLYDFKALAKKHQTENILLLGNPPWVTNSKLGQLDSQNLPRKRNIKQLNGFDALTGKSNFDIAEFILVELFKHFEKHNGLAAFLIKNSVIKNIIQDAQKKTFQINEFQQYTFNAKKEFNVATDASVFVASLHQKGFAICETRSLYQPEYLVKNFGWYENNFVSNVEDYQSFKKYDGTFPFIWRSGVKHDCTKVFELKKENEHYINKQKETLNLEDDLIYFLIKSSQLKNNFIQKSANYVIITQKKIGESTHFIQESYPNLYHYLDQHREQIDNRKSSIYKGKPPFSIFGIGDYTFAKYKIAISGLYKKANFSLLIPEDDKPLIPDDTCYMIGFQNLKFAVILAVLLNSENCLKFLNAITFQDAKRVYTKDVLMRIDLLELLRAANKNTILEKSNAILKQLNQENNLILEDILAFERLLKPKETIQMSLF